MRKIIIIMSFALLSIYGYGQVSGDVVRDNRKLITEQSFIIEGHVTGKIVFNIAVDSEGKITSAIAVDKESTIKSSPAKIKARNYVTTFQFEPNTWFPKHHQGKITITMVKPK